MNTRLISATPNAEEHILYVARVSSNQDNNDPKLLKFLIRNQHWSPFELAHMVIEISTSRAISRQILRHRSFSFQEFSQRYAKPDGYEIYSPRRSGATNRQSSINDLDEETKFWFIKEQRDIAKKSFDLYNAAVSKGIALESARFILPESTLSKLEMSGTLRSWIHYIELRSTEHTQLEHREIVLRIKDIFCEQFPFTSSALGWIGDGST